MCNVRLRMASVCVGLTDLRVELAKRARGTAKHKRWRSGLVALGECVRGPRQACG